MNYLTDINATQIPWTESPFFVSLCVQQMDQFGFNWARSNEYRYSSDFFNHGFVVIDLELTDQEIASIVEYMTIDAERTAWVNTQEGGYHYNDSPRIFEGWKNSNAIRSLSLNKKVLDALRLLYAREPIPFQTINFIKGTDQPLHSDTIHFHSIPERWMAACWVALEDMTTDNGPLVIVPGSHTIPCYTFQDLGLGVPKYGEQFDHYKQYEEFIAAVVTAKNMRTEKVLIKKGQAIIWAANLLHGGSKIINHDLTRLSQVTHYFFEGCSRYYSPMFSDVGKGIFADKDLSTKDFYKA